MANGRARPERDPSTERHIFRELGFASIDEYQRWCNENHLPSSVRKSDLQRRQERELFQRQAAERALRQARQSHNPSHAITRIFLGEIDETTIVDEPLKIIAQACRKHAAAAGLRDYLIHVDSAGKLLTSRESTIAVLNLYRYQREWCRNPTEWRPRSHNVEKQVASLAVHLLCDYEPPAFMTAVWYKKNRTRQRWYIHLGKGGSIRTAAGLPAPLTKRMAHWFTEAPDLYTPLAAIRYGQVRALGGDRRIADALLSTRLGLDFRDNAFGLELIRFFVRNPMLDTAHYQPIVDFIWNQKYENQAVFVGRGVVEERGPAQPGLSMGGRTPEALLRQVEEWHARLGRTAKGGVLQWTKSAIPDFELVEGKRESRNMCMWRIIELVSSRELEDEGRTLGHCVATYASSCHRGVSSIWSMRRETETGVTRLLTVEIDGKRKQIVQARGLRNRMPEAKEMSVLTRWARAAGLTVATWVS
ncbi:MAG: hypothetical protein EA403_03585 [Spirochaetaceae bacterium]|nr:MAG: hypothetical protein EA403_03585 [Spirochaetaceae bacterium]